jgi:putative membrane protein
MAERKSTYMTKAIRRYRNLFTLPNYRVLLFLLFFIVSTGSMVAFVLTTLNFDDFLIGLKFALQGFFFPVVITDLIINELGIRSNEILNLKRNTSLSLVLCTTWIIIMIVAGLIQLGSQTSQVLFKSTFFSLSIVVALRYLVLNTATHLSCFKIFVLSIAQPIVLFISNSVFWNVWSLQIVAAVLISSAILIIATHLFIYIVNRKGIGVVGIGSIVLFKGFVANWLEDVTHHLETHFEKLGICTDVTTSVFTFKNGNEVKGIMVVPNIHPGPFRNLGSSDLPGMIQRSMERKYSAITAVPHGLSGHELDLTSQSQCKKIIKELLTSNPVNSFYVASKLVRVNIGRAKATCQFLGEIAVFTITRAPHNMEDIPLEIGDEILQRCNSYGVKHAVIIDAHNSIVDVNRTPILTDEETQELVYAAEQALIIALKEKRNDFYIGISKIVPDEFGVSQGMGPGGIIALAIIVDNQKTVYIVLDGNNMISGLREEIIKALTNFDEIEILTTDTHIVNAITTIERGYNPIGEAIDPGRLLSYIKIAANNAIDNAIKGEIAFTTVQSENIKVIGEDRLLHLSLLIDLTFNLMRQLAPLIYVPALTLSLLPFFWLP